MGKFLGSLDQLVYYKIGITNEICVLELDNGQNLKLPNYVLVPITQIRMFSRIVKSNYKVRLYIGNGIYRKLRPIWVETDLRNFEKTHQHELTDDHLEQDTNQENDYGFHYGFVQVAAQSLRNFEKTHQHEPTDDHLEQDTNQENDYGFHYGFVQVAAQSLRNFEKTHQHEPTDDHLEQDKSRE